MENASKALIIAGAILLSILIIALGMRIFNSADSASANADLSATEIQSFNATFLAYSERQKGTSVRSLITAIISSNAKNTDRVIAINGATAGTGNATTPGTAVTPPSGVTFTSTTGLYTTASVIESNRTYTVSFDFDPISGIIVNANIV